MNQPSPSTLLRGAFGAVHRNPGPLLLYLGITVPFSLACLLLFHFLEPAVEETEPGDFLNLLEFLIDLAGGAVSAIAASIAFSRLGRELDKPLWKVRDDRQALRRFFIPWLILFLGANALLGINELLISAASPETYLLWYLLSAGLVFMCLIPIGGCIMFSGDFHWRRLGDILSPLARQFRFALLFFYLGFMASITLSYIALALRLEGAALYGIPVVEILDGYLECAVFAGIWEICRIDRNAPPEADIDFY